MWNRKSSVKTCHSRTSESKRWDPGSLSDCLIFRLISYPCILFDFLTLIRHLSYHNFGVSKRAGYVLHCSTGGEPQSRN